MSEQIFKNITIQSQTGPYTVYFREGTHFLKELAVEQNFFIIDQKIYDLYKKDFLNYPMENVLLIEASEENKDLSKIPLYIEALTNKGLKKNHTLIAIGGGITQDITCFIAAIIFRGIKWAFVPTTLLAQADSCIGSKSSINCSGVKNLIGDFYPPSKIHLSLTFLNSLENSEILSGIGEILKVHMVKGISEMEDIINNFDKLNDLVVLRKYIWNALLFKKELIEVDELDLGPRNIMNYGHTFGHALEKATNHQIPHGIAVTIGMDMANLYAKSFSYCGNKPFDLTHPIFKNIYQKYNDVRVNDEVFFNAIKKDKKNLNNQITLILPIGSKYNLEKVAVDFNESFVNFCQSFFRSMSAL